LALPLRQIAACGNRFSNHCWTVDKLLLQKRTRIITSPPVKVTSSIYGLPNARSGSLVKTPPPRQRFPAFSGKFVKKAERLRATRKQATLPDNYVGRLRLSFNFYFILEG
jgi:hypothetical protein